ncbi:TPA: glycosyltransferase [Streptococcus suis]
MEKELISIIMSVYNAEKTINTCIESIIDQDYQNWEFIICDDCSTDSTYKILKEYQRKDSRIKVIRNIKNSKLAFSLNHCLRYCNGTYVARMDDDDISLPNRFSKQVAFLNSHPEFQLVGSCAYVDNGKSKNSIRKVKQIPTQRDILLGPTFIHPSIMIRKDSIDELEGYAVAEHTNRGQDWELWFRFFSRGFKGYNLQEPLIIYRFESGSLQKRTLKSCLGYIKIAYLGFRKLSAPWYLYPLVLKPAISYFYIKLFRVWGC